MSRINAFAQVLPRFNLKTGLSLAMAALVAGSGLVVAFHDDEVEAPRHFSKVKVNFAPRTPTTQDSAPQPAGNGSLIFVDEDGNRVAPTASEVDDLQKPDIRTNAKTGFSYSVHPLQGGMKALVPNNPIQVYTRVEKREDGSLEKQCLKIPSSVVQEITDSKGADKGASEE